MRGCRPWAGSDHQPAFHDKHHEKFKGNYGNMQWLDFIHGTTFPEPKPKARSKRAAATNGTNGAASSG